MPPRSTEPLRKVTLNLFEADCADMERIHGHGWSEVVRALVRAELLRKKRIRGANHPIARPTNNLQRQQFDWWKPEDDQ